MSAKYSKGRLKQEVLQGTDERGETIFHCGLGIREGRHLHEQEHNAARLCSCWNACLGIEAPAAAIDIAGEALREVFAEADTLFDACHNPGTTGYLAKFVGQNLQHGDGCRHGVMMTARQLELIARAHAALGRSRNPPLAGYSGKKTTAEEVSRFIQIERAAKDAEKALDQLLAAVGDRLLAKGPLSKEYANGVCDDIRAAQKALRDALGIELPKADKPEVPR